MFVDGTSVFISLTVPIKVWMLQVNKYKQTIWPKKLPYIFPICFLKQTFLENIPQLDVLVHSENNDLGIFLFSWGGMNMLH